jgi:MFS family permease
MWGVVRLPRTFAALRHRNFRLFYFGQLTSLIGTWMQDTARGWLVVLLATPAGLSLAEAAGGGAKGTQAEQTANLYLGMIAAAGSLPVLFGSLYGGIVADRFSKRTIILLAQTAQMLLAFLLTALILRGDIRIWHVVVLSLLVGVTNIFDIPARQSFLVEMVGREDLPNAIALQSSIFNAARAFGPALTGVLLGVLQGRSEERALAECFLINGVSYLAVLAGLLAMRGDFSAKGTSAGSPLTALREVRAFLGAKRGALLLVSLVAVFSLCNAPYFVLLPSLAKFTLGAGAGAFGMLGSCQGLGALAAALLMATLSDRGRKGRILVGASLTFPVLLLILAFNRSLYAAGALVFLIGFALICFLATANTLLQTSTPDALRGRVMSLYSLILIGLTPVGSLWAGAVAKAAGAPAAIATGAALILIVAASAALRYPAFRRADRVLPDEI